MFARYLHRRGKRHFCFVASQREDVQFLTRNRLLGVRQYCERQGLEPPQVCVIASERAESRLIMRELLARSEPPWGICCYNDEVAFVVIAALTDEGIAIPEQAAVIGCDDIPLASFSIPPLTTIHFEHEQTLDPLVAMIVALAQGENVEEAPQAAFSIIERQSA